MKRALMVCGVAMLVFAQPMSAAELPGALIDPYLQVQGALSSDQITGVTGHAQSIAAAATALGKDAEAIAASARKLGAAKDIAAARTAFGEVSEAIEAYATMTKATFPAGVRVAFCPMADKPWLTKDKDIRNPYYGAAMATCGSFKK